MKRYHKFLSGALTCAIVLIGSETARAASEQTPSAAASGKSDKSSSTEDPKCSFLRQELLRLQASPFAGLERVPATARPSYERAAAEVGLSIVQGKIDSCGRKEKLSSPARLRRLESARLELVNKIRLEEGRSADGLINAVNELYEQEAKSFYNYETVRVANVDSDVVKDFPMLLDLVRTSSLPDEFKTSFTQNFKFIKYEEAGRLQNGLRGTDKDLGTTFAYVLRSDLNDRARADAENRKAIEEARLKQMKVDAAADAQQLARVRRNARITLSISALTVLGLIGFILVRREVVAWPAWLNVMIIAAILSIGWILIGMGVLNWIMEYMNLAF